MNIFAKLYILGYYVSARSMTSLFYIIYKGTKCTWRYAMIHYLKLLSIKIHENKLPNNVFIIIQKQKFTAWRFLLGSSMNPSMAVWYTSPF